MTSTDLAIPEELPNPLTGELVRTADLETVGLVIEALRERKRLFDIAIAAFSAAVIAESQRRGTKTFQVGGVELKVGTGSELDWDHTVLPELLTLGLPQARYDELVTTKVEFKVNGTVARQIAGASREYAEVIERAKIRKPKRPAVTLTRRPVFDG